MKKHWNKILVGFNVVLLTVITFFLSGMRVFADDPDEDELISLYNKFDSILHIDDGFMIQNSGRKILWGIVKVLSWVNNVLEGAVTKIVGVNGFYQAPVMQKIMDIIVPLAFGLFVISLFFLGIQFMLNKIEKREEVLLNITMAVAVIFVIPVLVTQMHNVLGFGVGYTSQLSPTLSGSIVQSNIADLQYYVEKDFKVSGAKRGTKNRPPLPQSKESASVGTSDYTFANQLNKDKTSLDVEITETIDIKESIWGNAKDKWAKKVQDENPTAYNFLKHKKLPTGVSDENTIMELHKNVIPATNLGKEAYYRYHVNWGVTIFTLLVTTFALGITLVKVGRMMFDIVFTQFFAMFVAVTDLTGGQRTKKVLTELASSFGVLFIMVFIMQLFIYYANWVNGLKSDIGTIAVVLMLIAGAWALMDAPDIVQRMMGIDAGLRSGYGALMGAAAATSLAGRGFNMAKGVVGKTASVGAGMAGMAKGAYDGIRGGGGGSGNSQPKMPSSGGENDKGRDLSNIPPDGGGGNTPNDGGGESSPIPSNSEGINLNGDKREAGRTNQQKLPENKQRKQSGQKSNKKSDQKIPKRQSGIPNSSQAEGNPSGAGFDSTIGGQQIEEGIPSGWKQRDSGIILPNNSTAEVDNLTSGIDSISPIGNSTSSGEQMDGGSTPISDTSIEESIPSSPQMDNITERLDNLSNQVAGVQQATRGYGTTGGIITGSALAGGMGYAFNRGKASGQFLGNSVRAVGSTGLGALSQTATQGKAVKTFTKGKAGQAKRMVRSVSQGATQAVSQSPSVTYARGVASNASQTVREVGGSVTQAVSQSPSVTYARGVASNASQTVREVGGSVTQAVSQSPTVTYARGVASNASQTVREVGGSVTQAVSQSPSVTYARGVANNASQTVRGGTKGSDNKRVSTKKGKTKVIKQKEEIVVEKQINRSNSGERTIREKGRRDK